MKRSNLIYIQSLVYINKTRESNLTGEARLLEKQNDDDFSALCHTVMKCYIPRTSRLM